MENMHALVHNEVYVILLVAYGEILNEFLIDS